MPDMILLPDVCNESQLPALLKILGEPSGTIEVDFGRVRFYSQGALVTLISRFVRWQETGNRVVFMNAENSPAFRYFQRMDFFKTCGLEFKEDFVRNSSSERFLTITEIPKDESKVESIACEVADCISPWDEGVGDSPAADSWEIIVFVLTELANNAVQHSHGSVFVAAQHIPKTQNVRVAIGDTGIGILQSFLQSGFPPRMDDLDAIRLALKNRVSSKGGAQNGLLLEPRNAGVGLTMIRELILQSGGTFTVTSGNAFYQLRSNGTERAHLLEGTCSWGTICCLEFRRGSVAKLSEVAEKVRSL